MNRMYVISSVSYRPADAPEAPPTVVEDLGFSIVSLMKLSDGEATGVRADLEIKNQAALNELAQYYAQNQRLKWTFTVGGGGGSFTVVLRWTKFDRLAGTLQVVKTAVMCDLISELEEDEESPAPTQEVSSDDAPTTTAAGSSQNQRDHEQSSPSTEPAACTASIIERMSSLWPRLLDEEERSEPEPPSSAPRREARPEV